MRAAHACADHEENSRHRATSPSQHPLRGSALSKDTGRRDGIENRERQSGANENVTWAGRLPALFLPSPSPPLGPWDTNAVFRTTLKIPSHMPCHATHPPLSTQRTSRTIRSGGGFFPPFFSLLLYHAQLSRRWSLVCARAPKRQRDSLPAPIGIEREFFTLHSTFSFFRF